MRRLALALLSFAWQPPAFAQNVEPEVTVQQLSSKAGAPIAEDEPEVVSSDEFYRLRSKASSAEEIAVVRILFKGKWYKSADNMAKEKAASLGANGLVLVESLGREDVGAVRAYRVFRLTNAHGGLIYTKPAPEAPSAKPPDPPVPGPVAPPKVAEAASVPPSSPWKHRHFDWLWTKAASTRTHRLGFDTTRASKDEAEQLRLYVRENFPPVEYKKLLKAYDRRSRLVLDFVSWKVE